jgi:hypothetical protein
MKNYENLPNYCTAAGELVNLLDANPVFRLEDVHA